LDKNASLEEKIIELEGDKKHFQNKLEEYIRYDKEEEANRTRASSSGNDPHLEKQVAQLIAEKTNLQSELSKRSDLLPSHSERDQRALLLKRLNDLEANSRANEDYFKHQVEMLKTENSRLREQVEALKRSSYYGDRRGSGFKRPPSWEAVHSYQYLHSTGEGHSSLPESLSSYSSHSSKHSDLPNVAGLHLDPKPQETDVATAAAELKRVKKQLEKYKTVNIELDQKLKDAKLELRKFAEQRTVGDVGYRMDVERLRSENAQLHTQLDRVQSENNHLRSLVGRRY